jgi:hypothetical protein
MEGRRGAEIARVSVVDRQRPALRGQFVRTWWRVMWRRRAWISAHMASIVFHEVPGAMDCTGRQNAAEI